MPVIDRDTPYWAPHAPRSPRRLALVALAGAVLSGLALALELPWLKSVDPELVVGVLLGLVALVGVAQDRAARGEQRRGQLGPTGGAGQISDPAADTKPGEPRVM